ncbi:MAG: glycosyltransferase [Marinoscillum sp.]
MIFFVAFSVVYVFFLLWARLMWGRIQPASDQGVSEYASFSVVVPVRNESENILKLLEDLESQDYPKSQFEVVVVDDNSEDNTMDLVTDYLDTSSLTHRLLSLGDLDLQGKKFAITEAVQSSKNDYILTIDGDCRVGTQWIKAYNEAYQIKKPMMVTGPVKMNHPDFFTKLQAGEFAGLIMIGASSLYSGNPSMCNGANLSYQREAFMEVDGYKGNEHIPSGDDEFLLQKIFKAYDRKVMFLKDQRAIVSTDAKQSFLALLNQRIRWSSKWKFHKSFFIKLLALFIFLNYLALFVGVIEGISNQQYLLVAVIFVVRWITLWYFSVPITQFLGIKNVLGVSLVIEIIYPFFVTFLGIASIFGKYSWKGRYYS